jgi:hypothetical protein
MVIKAADNTGKLSSTNQSYTGRELAVWQGSPFPMTVAQLSMAAGNQLIRDLGRKLSDFYGLDGIDNCINGYFFPK